MDERIGFGLYQYCGKGVDDRIGSKLYQSFGNHGTFNTVIDHICKEGKKLYKKCRRQTIFLS